jgi:hypothetical protein
MHISTQLTSKVDKSAKTGPGPSFAPGNNHRSESGSIHTPDGELDLQDMDFVEKVGEPRSFDPEHRHKLVQEKIATWRQIFLSGLTHQIALVHDPDYQYPHQKFVQCDGVMGRELDYIAPEPWWYEQDGELRLRLNFGERRWCVKGKNPVIRIGAAEELLPTLEKLHLLTVAGELDEIIEKMVIVSHS